MLLLLDCKRTNFMVTSKSIKLELLTLGLDGKKCPNKTARSRPKNQQSLTIIHPEPSKTMLESKDLIVPTALVAVPSSVWLPATLQINVARLQLQEGLKAVICIHLGDANWIPIHGPPQDGSLPLISRGL